MTTIKNLSRRLAGVAAVAALVVAMGGTWMTSSPADATPTSSASTTSAAAGAPVTHPADTPAAPAPAGGASTKSTHKELVGKLNLNTATEEQLMLLPTVGPAKAERVVEWRKKNGGFKRAADLRRVKGFGYQTFRKLEPFLDIKGDTTLAVK